MSRPAAHRTPRAVRTPQQARSRRTREQILVSAVRCFEQRGYETTTTAAIARSAGIGVGTLYGYFADKRAILLELLETTVGEMAAHVLPDLELERWRGADPRERVRALIDAIVRTRTITPGIQRILWERYFSDTEFRAAVGVIESSLRGALEKLLTSLREQGSLRVADARTAAFVVHMAVEWTATRLMLGDDDADPAATVDAASDMIWRYLFHTR